MSRGHVRHIQLGKKPYYPRKGNSVLPRVIDYVRDLKVGTEVPNATSIAKELVLQPTQVTMILRSLTQQGYLKQTFRGSGRTRNRYMVLKHPERLKIYGTDEG